jgi:hypothetical protein
MTVKTPYLSANHPFEGDFGRYLWVFRPFLLTDRVMPPKKLAHSRQVIGSKGKCDLGLTLSTPRNFVFRSPPTVFAQPKTSSILFRILRLFLYPSCRVVRPSTAEPLTLLATWGVMPLFLIACTNSLTSYPLSAPRVAPFFRIVRRAIVLAASRSAVLEVRSWSRHQPPDRSGSPSGHGPYSKAGSYHPRTSYISGSLDPSSRHGSRWSVSVLGSRHPDYGHRLPAGYRIHPSV